MVSLSGVTGTHGSPSLGLAVKDDQLTICQLYSANGGGKGGAVSAGSTIAMLFTERRDGRDQLSVGTDFKQQPGLLNAELPDFNPAGGQSAEAGSHHNPRDQEPVRERAGPLRRMRRSSPPPVPAGLKLPKKHQTKISLQGGLDSLVRLRESQNSVATARIANTLPAIIAMRTAFLLMLRVA